MLEHGADLDRELLLAMAALVQAVTDALCRVRLDLAEPIQCATMRTDRLAVPDDILQEREGGFLVVKAGLG